MVHKKRGLPQEEELVIGTVKKVLPHSIFVDLDEYENKEGYLHISEIAPGRIRNIRDYVKEGKKIICKVLNINREKGHIDLSLRRVSTSMRKAKNAEYKQEQKAEKILESVARSEKMSLEEFYKKIGNKILQEYGLLHAFFQELVLKGEKVAEDLNIPPAMTKDLMKIVKEKLKAPEVKINADLILKSNSANGIILIKDALQEALNLSKKNDYKTKVTYLGAPRYRVTVTAPDYKSAEKILHAMVTTSIQSIKKVNGEGSFIRVD